MTDTTLAQRLREPTRQRSRKGVLIDKRPEAIKLEAADRIEADATTITRLTAANKALTGEVERWEKRATTGDGVAERLRAKLAKVEAERLATAYRVKAELNDDANRERHLRLAAEAKLAKVEARLLNWQAKAAELDVDRDRISAELAEARRVIEKSDEDLRSIHLHIDEHSFPRAKGIISQALFRCRSFLASKEASHAE